MIDGWVARELIAKNFADRCQNEISLKHFQRATERGSHAKIIGEKYRG